MTAVQIPREKGVLGESVQGESHHGSPELRLFSNHADLPLLWE